MWKNPNLKILPLWRTSNVNNQSNVIVKAGNYFLSLDDKSLQKCKVVKINNIQEYDP